MSTISRGRAGGWASLVAVMIAIAYASNLVSDSGPAADVLFRWSTAVSAAVVYAIIGTIVFVLIDPLERPLVGLTRPRSWGSAAGYIVGGFVAIGALSAALAAAGLDAGHEQGLVPDHWINGRAAAFAANFVVIAVVAPVVEETTFRGLGFGILRQIGGVWPAIFGSALLFGLAHGLLVALPVLMAFGAVLAFVRARTGSIYPPMILHATFNAISLIAGVAGVGS